MALMLLYCNTGIQVTDRILRHIVNAYRLIYQGSFSIQDAFKD